MGEKSLEQELADLNKRIKEIGKKCHKKQLRETWERSFTQAKKDIADVLLTDFNKLSYNEQEFILEIVETIQNFPIPEYREPEQKETE